MLNDLNTHQKDTNIAKNALKCAMLLAFIFLTLFILIYYRSSIYSGGLFVLYSISNIITTVFVSSAQILKPVFDSVGIYIIVFSAFVSLWSFCVFSKIHYEFFATSAQWFKISFIALVSSILYNIIYVVYLETSNNPVHNYGGVYALLAIIYTFLLIFLLSEHIDRKKIASLKKP